MDRLQELLIEYIQRPGYRPMKPKALAKSLGVKKKNQARFESVLEAAEAAGQVRISETGRVQARRPEGTYRGILRKISSGDAFLILHEPKPREITGDVFISRRDVGDAQNGDEVLIRLLKRRRSRGQRCGAVIDVLERATNVFVGTYFEEDDSGWVRIDGKNLTEPVWVGDPGAKGARENDKVVVEMLRFPGHGQVGEAVLTKVLGPHGDPGVDTQTIIHEFGLPDEFPEPVLKAARLEAENFDAAMVERSGLSVQEGGEKGKKKKVKGQGRTAQPSTLNPQPSTLEDREDLTKKTIVTIDPADARDFDDAISLERSPDGHWHLGVHIADVSHFVQPGTELDREAQLRGTSVYLPNKVIPMLPEVISNGLASLQEKRVRYAMSAFVEFTAEGVPVHTRFSRTAIRVTKRFAYEDVLPIIRAEEPSSSGSEDNKSSQRRKPRHVPAKVRKLLAEMYELAMLLRKRRFEKGALELDLPEVRLEFDEDGKVSGAYEAPHDESHQIIEEFMLAANIAVATELTDRGHSFLRRTHGSPSESKLRSLAEFAAILGYPIKKTQSRRDLQGMLNQVKGQPEERSLNYAFLRSLKQAEYSPVVEGHYALAEEHYCHFTSPIRRYPDLQVHRLMAAIVTGNDAYLPPGMDELLKLGSHCSMTERRAERAERELIKIKLLTYLEDRIGEQFDAVITGVERYGFFCRGIELPAEGLVHISTFPATDHYDHDRTAMALIGRRSGETFRLGDRVRVEVAHVDVDGRELDFRLVRHQARPKTGSGTPREQRQPSEKSGSKKNSSAKKKRKTKASGKRKKKGTKRKRG
jgi:ribonuclease R